MKDNQMPAAKSKAEARYICKRKWKAFLNSLCFYVCRIFPIKHNLISVCAFEGRNGFCCNPKYVVQELHRRNPEYEFVWFVNDMSKILPDYIKKVPNTLWNRAYYLSRSKVWLDNYRKPYGTIKRRNQYYMNTNHYTVGIKCTGLWRGEGFSRMAYLVSKNDSDMVDDLITDSTWTMDVSPKGFVYDGTYLNIGAPRCDVLFGDRTPLRQAFRKRHNLPDDAKVVMYAPTFREGAKDGKRFVFSEIWTLDFKRLLDTLEQKTGDKWYLCVRVHPQLAPTFSEYKNDALTGRIVDESQADDMYELLAGMDAYITDYSSAVFEAGFAHIPSFVYADDIQEYAHDRGNLMWNFATDSLDRIGNNKMMTPNLDVVFPFPVSADNDCLMEQIAAFDQLYYDNTLNEFHKKINLVFTGHASSDAADEIERRL